MGRKKQYEHKQTNQHTYIGLLKKCTKNYYPVFYLILFKLKHQKEKTYFIPYYSLISICKSLLLCDFIYALGWFLDVYALFLQKCNLSK